MNYYKILGIRNDADEKTIKKAYHGLAIKYHPDKGGDMEKFKKISEAYEILSDKDKKYKYDNNYPLDYNETFVNPYDLFEHIIKKSDIHFMESKINSWLYQDFDVEDNFEDSIFKPRGFTEMFSSLHVPNNSNNFSRSIQSSVVIKNGKKYTKKAIIENGVRKEYENVEDLTNNYILS